ncbi:unnamed protein product, partial [Rotaria sp. Silwood1]
IYIPLEERNVEQPVEEKLFEIIMMYKNPNNRHDVDLLSIIGIQQKINLYVTSLIDIILHVKNYSNLMQQKLNLRMVIN